MKERETEKNEFVYVLLIIFDSQTNTHTVRGWTTTTLSTHGLVKMHVKFIGYL